MIFRFLFYLFLFYLLYKLVFDLVLPVYRATRQVKRGFREMQEKMQQQETGYEGQPQADEKAYNGSGGEYIDFEEVKD
jgi:hypothetical protein